MTETKRSCFLYCRGLHTRAKRVASVSLESEMRNASQVGIKEERPAHPLASAYTPGLLVWPETGLHGRGKAVVTADMVAESQDPATLLGNTAVCSPSKAKEQRPRLEVPPSPVDLQAPNPLSEG